MTEITFVQPRYQYDSYEDYRTLVTSAGHQFIYVDEMQLADPSKTYIVTPINGEFRPHLDGFGTDKIRATVYAWMLERPGSGTLEQFCATQREMMDCGYVADIIVSDRWLAEQCGYRYVPMGLTPELGEPGPYSAKRYDIIHLMCPSYRRSKWFMGGGTWQPLTEVDHLKVAPNGWGVKRHGVLQQSRFMLALHQDDHHIIEPLRYTLAAAYGLPLLAEYSRSFFPYDVCGGVFNVIQNPRDGVAALLERSEAVYTEGLAFRQRMLERYSFNACLQEYL